MDLLAARNNMIEQQIRSWNVLNDHILKALHSLCRENFIEPKFRQLAYADIRIPLAHGEEMLEPKIDARMVQALDLQKDNTVLEIGTGSGFVTALLASLAKNVTSYEIHDDLSKQAKENLAYSAQANVSLHSEDVFEASFDDTRYDAIFIGGSLNEVPESLFSLLKGNEGRLVAITGDAPAMQATLFVKKSEQIEEQILFETQAPRLRNTKEAKVF